MHDGAFHAVAPPRVSVIIAAWQQVTFLQQALQSVVNQTFRDFEVVVTDDSASAEVARCVSSFNDPRLRYRANPRRLGIALNHLAGYHESRGSLLANLNHDDLWAPEFLEQTLAGLDAHPEAIAAFSEFHVIDVNGDLLSERTEAELTLTGRAKMTFGVYDSAELLLQGGMPMAMAALFQRDLVMGSAFPRTVGGAYDAWLCHLLARQRARVVYLPQRLTFYRVHAESATETRGFRNLREGVFVSRRIVKSLCGNYNTRDFENRIGVASGNCAVYLARRYTFWRARPFFLLALSLIHRPKNLVALVGKMLISMLHSLSRRGSGHAHL
jgi:glycosyltransferase involved in cell wall biosynthesis